MTPDTPMAFSYDNNNEIFALQGARRAKTSFSWQPACGELTFEAEIQGGKW
jgi:hypothetical protein